MSGGDIALVRSIENFEDHPAYGARQVRELGFQEGDLMIATTEGGETPSVIGALEEAARISRAPHYVLFCNPPELLAKNLERCRRFIENPAIRKVPILTGPMAISGSTRLQASTVLMLAVGVALFSGDEPLSLKRFIEFYRTAPVQNIRPFIEWESGLYAEGGYTSYETDRYGITIFTDTTERSPTFSLAPVENALDSDAIPALAYLYFPQVKGVDAAWKELLLRDPIPVEWPELASVSNWERLRGYDFSASAREDRAKRLAGKKIEGLSIVRQDGVCRWRAPRLSADFDVSGLHPLFEHVFLKLLLNTHSTLLMGRLGRYEGNLMTWVKPSNNKLIDRAIRYVQALLDRSSGKTFSYEEVCYALFQELESLRAEEPIVLRTLAALRA
jgi:N-acetylmuramic acid 6-phosphate etherase